jgi:DNA-directed RNA polymerase specialized sigma subunit
MEKVDKNLVIYNAWREDPNDQNTQAVLKAVDPAVNNALKSYAGGDMRMKTRARIMALKALKNYDPNKGSAVNTYVMNQLRPLTREARERKSPVHIPENAYLHKRKLTEAYQMFEEKHNRPPSDQELADSTGISLKQIKRANQYSRNFATASAASSESGDSFVERKEDPLDTWKTYVYHDLEPIDKKIFEHTTGYNGNTIKPKSQIAAELKMSPAAVSQRVNKIATKLQEMPDENII